MIYIIYNILLYCYFFISLPFYLVKFFTSERYRVGLRERLGFIKKMPHKPRILVHTVSVGEFLGTIPLINALRDKYRQHEIVVSTTTVTGNKVAKKKLGGASRVVYFPLDFLWSVKRFFDRVLPDLIILVETELWPNFLSISKKRNVPVLIINGRISERSYRNYSLLPGFFRNMCSDINSWGVQFERDSRRLIDLGIDSERIHVTGSIKFDSAIQNIPDPSDIDKIKKEWGWKEGDLVLVGGSTHDGEEKILLDIYKDIKDNFKNLVLILAPRHPNRIEEIKKIVRSYKLRYILKSELKGAARFADYDIVLVDTLGDLVLIYNLATIVFIGKSLVKGGGQNLLEPAGLGKPVICGPLMGNFLDITKWLVENGGVVQVVDAGELKQAIMHLLNNPFECIKLGDRAKELIFKASGAVERNMELVKKVL